MQNENITIRPDILSVSEIVTIGYNTLCVGVMSLLGIIYLPVIALFMPSYVVYYELWDSY